MIPAPTKPLGGARYIFTEYIERNTATFPMDGTDTTTADKQLWLSDHKLTRLAGCTIECRFSTIGDNGGLYPLFFGTWRLKDALYQHVNYFGYNGDKMFFCQRLGSTSYGTVFGARESHGVIMDVTIQESTATVRTPTATYRQTTFPENRVGDYGCPFVGNTKGWGARYYYYRYTDPGYSLDCVPAYDRITGLYGMYDKVHKQFRGNIYFTGPR